MTLRGEKGEFIHMSDCGDGEGDIPVFQGKVIVLGDVRTGKSSLVKSLQPAVSNQKKTYSNTDTVDVFSVIEMGPQELKFAGNVLLKVCEYSGRDDPIVFEGALIVIITIDLRSSDSAYSAFSRWTALRDEFMKESFLFVVGTFLDATIERRVEVQEIIKACNQSGPSHYVEVSNTDGTNISLFRAYIAHTVAEMLRGREALFDAIDNSEHENHEEFFKIDPSASSDLTTESEQNKNGDASAGKLEEKLDIVYPVHAPFLEQNIQLGSVGTVLASSLGTEYWPGYENMKEELSQMGQITMEYVDRLGEMDAFIPSQPFEHTFTGRKSKPVMENSLLFTGEDEVSGCSSPIPEDETEDAFQIMGFKLPPGTLLI